MDKKQVSILVKKAYSNPGPWFNAYKTFTGMVPGIMASSPNDPISKNLNTLNNLRLSTLGLMDSNSMAKVQDFRRIR